MGQNGKHRSAFKWLQNETAKRVSFGHDAVVKQWSMVKRGRAAVRKDLGCWLEIWILSFGGGFCSVVELELGGLRVLVVSTGAVTKFQ